MEKIMSSEILVIAGTAATIGFVHTVLGPDHYLPFIVISRARSWPLPKTLFISFLCGLGHVLSSVVLGLAGIALGVAVLRLERVESIRGGAAAWLLIGLGFAYFIWGMHRAIKNKPHKHLHFHADGEEHEHLHIHEAEHTHLHEEKKKTNLTPWILFIIFVFGPCEPLIPLVMYPAAKHNLSGVILVSTTFGLATILTMLTIIAVSSWGVSFIRLGRLERYVHALAGAMIFISGLSVRFLGL
jgi:sulfite exporter TauE/SafE